MVSFLLFLVGMYDDDDPHENYVKIKGDKLQDFLEPFECKYLVHLIIL